LGQLVEVLPAGITGDDDDIADEAAFVRDADGSVEHATSLPSGKDSLVGSQASVSLGGIDGRLEANVV
jgi:hypothetical protein